VGGYLATSTKVEEEIREELVKVPEGVSMALSGSISTVNGPLGVCSRDFSNIRVNISVEGGVVKISPYSSRKRHMAVVNTARSIVENMIEGVTKGFTYKLKIAFAHFPVSVKVKGREVHIENFYGEKTPRVARIIGDCKVDVKDEDVIVRGVSIDDVGQTAANIEQATRVKKKDQRVFLDGVYIYEKRRGEY